MACVTDYLEASAEKFPDRAALSDDENTLSYRELRRLVYGVAAGLAEMGMSGRPVGVYSQRRAETVAVMLGIAASGNHYVPLNPEAPEAKTKKIIRHAGIGMIIGFCGGEYTGEEEGCVYCRFDRSMFPPSDVRPDILVSERDTLYIIYTSGSTGEPKGIRKSHGSVMDFIEAYAQELSFTHDEIIGNQTPFCFDASAKDIYLALKTGAHLEIIPSALFSFPVKLIEYLNERSITFISWVPSALAIITRLRTFRDVKPVTVRRAAFVGEVFPLKDLAAWREALPDIEYINLYGSSETAGIAALYRIPRDGPLPHVLPIGRPLSNSRIFLMDNGRLNTQQGEMLIASGALADEYIHDPDKTAATFEYIDIGGVMTRVLHTGDLARYDENGDLVFLSRNDAQIKYKGYRIELGEIEAAAEELPFIQSACCLYNAEKERITLFCTSDRPDLKLRELNEALSVRLADYMLPRKLVVLDAMPLNANGKKDRTYLKTLL